MPLKTRNVPVHPDTKKFEQYFDGAGRDIFQKFGLASVDVIVRSMNLLELETSLTNVLDSLKNQGEDLILPTNTDSQNVEILESLKAHPKEHYQAMITSTIATLSQHVEIT